MKVFVEKQVVAETFIGLIFFIITENRSSALFIFAEDIGKTRGKIVSDLSQVHHFTRTCWMLYQEIITVVMVKTLQRFNNKIIYRKPCGTAPVRISSEEIRIAFSGIVFY